MRFSLVVISLFFAIMAFAQFNPDHDKGRGTKREATKRDDLIWHPEAANVQYRHSGNISILTASRFGLNERWELSSYLGFEFWQPNAALKFLWNYGTNVWYFASKVNVATAVPGLRYARTKGFSDYVRPDDEIGNTFELGHEFLVSRAFSRDQNCSDGGKWLIVTGSIGTYFGVRNGDRGTVQQLPYHFVANRGMTLINSNSLFAAKLWADWQASGWLLIHGGLRAHNWSMRKNFDVELQAEAEFVFTTRFTARAGGAFSFANYERTKYQCGAIPIVDITYYFGKKKAKERDLFNPNGRLY